MLFLVTCRINEKFNGTSNFILTQDHMHDMCLEISKSYSYHAYSFQLTLAKPYKDIDCNGRLQAITLQNLWYFAIVTWELIGNS